MNKIILFSVILVLQTIFCPAQFQTEIPLAKPIPPNAAAMFKVLERPLGTFTGTIPVSFPLCSVTSGSLSANVALNYNSTGGIKISELPGCVGLGFSLADGGGRIVQQVKGLPDDMAGMLNSPYTQRPSNFGCTYGPDLLAYTMQQMDLEPDEYLYSFNGHSGKFFLHEDGTVVIQNNTGIKISMTPSPVGVGQTITGWTITDENGNKYTFGLLYANYSSYSGTTGSLPSRVSSRTWYLTQATDMNSENSISYAYTLSNQAVSGFSGTFMPITLQGQSCINFNTHTETGDVSTDATEYLLNKITAKSGSVVFNLSPDYQYGALKVNYIQLTDPTGVTRKQFRFNYGTFARGDLKLNSFSELGATGTDTIAHKFDYNLTQNLPSPLAFSQDFWGCYNGSSNPSLFPNFIYNLVIKWRYAGANLYPNATMGAADILTKITYPTGGSRSFIYEGNSALYNDAITAYSPDPTYTATRSNFSTAFHNWYPAVGPPSMQDTFTVNSVDGWTNLVYTLSTISSGCGSSYKVQIYKTSTEGNFSDVSNLITTFNGVSTSNYNLLNGYYRIDVFVTPSTCTIGKVTGTWNEYTIPLTTVSTPYGSFEKINHGAGGVRIKEIDDYDPVSSTTNKTSYKYQMYSYDSTLTSGMLISPLMLYGMENISGSYCYYPKLYIGTSYPLASESGSFVVYPEVRTIVNGDGWTDRQFWWQPDEMPAGFPLAWAYDYSYKRGKITSEKTYTAASTLIHSKSYLYSEVGFNFQNAVRLKPYWFITSAPTVVYSDHWPGTGYPQTPSMASCNNFSANGQFMLTSSITETTVAPSGNYTVTKTYQYKPYNRYYALAQEITSISNGQSKLINYNYSFDTVTHFALGLNSSELSFKSTLLTKNFLQPLETVDSLKPATGPGSFLDGAKYDLGYFNSSKLHLAQLKKFTTLSDSSIVNFSAYDTSGNLTEQAKNGDVKTVYLWGYGSQYLVASVTNSSYAAVTALVNMSVINNPSSDAAMRTELDKIRMGMASSQSLVTYYTYSTIYGMTSMTDPTGKTTFYQYDNHLRLQFVKDQNSNIIKRYNYQLNNP